MRLVASTPPSIVIPIIVTTSSHHPPESSQSFPHLFKEHSGHTHNRMSAPSLPNLLHSRGRGGRPLRRGRGGASSSAAVHPDEIVQRTDTDAAVSRLSAVELGYLDDPYARFFAQSSGPGDRRLPIINRGEWGSGQMTTREVTLTGLQVPMRGLRRWMVS